MGFPALQRRNSEDSDDPVFLPKKTVGVINRAITGVFVADLVVGVLAVSSWLAMHVFGAVLWSATSTAVCAGIIAWVLPLSIVAGCVVSIWWLLRANVLKRKPDEISA
jgi:preprotein translocase subunit SecF